MGSIFTRSAQFSARKFDQRYTEATRSWLDARFCCDVPEQYESHEPIWGMPSSGRTEGGHLRRAARLYDVLMLVSGFEATSMLDVGGAEGYLAYSARECLDLQVVSVDLSIEACARARQICRVPSVSVNAPCLPFADNSFDVVTLTEVIEHLIDPIGALLEARRVARKAVIVSTEEFACSEEERTMILSERELQSHGERNVFTREDFNTIFHELCVEICPQRFAPVSSLIESEIESGHLSDWLSGKMQAEFGGAIVVASTDPFVASASSASYSARMIESLSRGVCESEDSQSADVPIPSFGEIVVSHDGTQVVDSYRYVHAPTRICELAAKLNLAGEVLNKLLHLNRQFELLPAFESLSWQGREVLQGDDWEIQNFEAGDEDTGVVKGDDPRWISPFLCVPLDSIEFLKIDFEGELPHGEDCLQVYWQFEHDMSFSEEECVSLSYDQDQLERGFLVPIKSVSRNVKFLMRLRIDPTLRSDGMAIRIRSIQVLGSGAVENSAYSYASVE